VLQGAAAAGTEEGTGRLGAVGAGLEQLDDLALEATAPLPRHPRQHAVAGHGLGKEQRAAVDRGDAVALGAQRFHRQLDLAAAAAPRLTPHGPALGSLSPS